MGLQTVELIMRVEEEFAIEILDGEAELLATPGALCDFIAYKLGPRKASSASSPCPTSRAFYAVRCELMQLGIERERVTPKTSITALWPRSQRRRNWNNLSKSLDADLPPLRRSPEWAFLALLSLSGLPIWLAISPLTANTFVVIYSSIVWLGFYATKPLAAVHAPAELQSIADLSRYLMPRYCISNSVISCEIWPQVRQLIADEFGIPIEQITPDADFVRDLGLG